MNMAEIYGGRSTSSRGVDDVWLVVQLSPGRLSESRLGSYGVLIGPREYKRGR